jgi:hypothetical protein
VRRNTTRLAVAAGFTAMDGGQLGGSVTIDPFGIMIVTVTSSGRAHA